jgi:hypothetical protein
MGRPRPNGITDDQIISAYAATHDAHKVAEDLGLGSTTIYRVLARANIPRVGLTEHRAARKAGSTAPFAGRYTGSTEDILVLYQAGMSVLAIAKVIGRSVSVVGRRVRQAGIVRPFGGQGPAHSMWEGGRIKIGSYWSVWVDSRDPLASMRNGRGYVLEHRLFLARAFGRPLSRSETVHHINGDSSDNRLENLQLRQGKHGKHIVMRCCDCGSTNVQATPIA